MKNRRLTLLSFVFLLLSAQTLRAQTSTTFDQGVNPYSSLHGGDIDSIVLSNGNLLLHVPLISYPQRGKLHLGFFAAYDNRKIVATKTGTPTQETTVWGVQGHGVHVMSDLPWPNIIPKSTYPASYWAVTPDATHLMQSTSDGYLSVDATGFLFNTASNVMIDRDGIRTSANGALSGYTGPTTIEDPNGNLMTISYNSTNGTETLTDSLGRSIPFPTSTSVGVSTTDFSGCSGALPTSAATVHLPCSRSFSMSRRLLACRRLEQSRPIEQPAKPAHLAFHARQQVPLKRGILVGAASERMYRRLESPERASQFMHEVGQQLLA